LICGGAVAVGILALCFLGFCEKWLSRSIETFLDSIMILRMN
jgi:hypothetical protein